MSPQKSRVDKVRSMLAKVLVELAQADTNEREQIAGLLYSTIAGRSPHVSITELIEEELADTRSH